MNPPPPPPPAPNPADVLRAAILNWKRAKEMLAAAKSSESQFRGWLAQYLFATNRQPNGAFPEGTTKTSLDIGNEMVNGKVVQKIKREIEEALMAPTLAEAQLTPEQGMGLIKVSYEISVSKLKELPPDKRAIVEKMLVIKPASIELEIELVPKS